MARNAAAQLEEKPPQLKQTELFEAPEPEAEEHEEIEVAPKPEEKKEEQVDPTEALKKQIAELQKSEQMAKRQAEEAAAKWEREKAEYEARVAQTAASMEEARLETIETALTAANSDAESAQRDLQIAIENADPRGQAEAQRRLSTAVAHIARLEDGKVDIEQQIAAAKVRAEKKPEPQVEDPIDRMNLPSAAKNWLREHPEYARDPRKNIKVQALHWDVVDEGHEPFSTDYFVSLETKLGIRKPEQQEQSEEVEVVREQPAKRTSIVSAPVSREVPTGGAPKSKTRVTLTDQEREMARSAGITEAEYAKQKLRLQQLKAEGHYGDR